MREEQFDVYDENWVRIGTASRSETHRLGLRHRTFHCWLIRSSGGNAYVRFQKRQMDKDTYPGFLDITAAGHLSAGESVREAMRELEEELGITASYSELLPLGYHEERSLGEAGGIPFIDHERSEEFALLCEIPLLSHRLQREEVAGIYEAGLDELIELFDGRIQTVNVQGAEWPTDGEAPLPSSPGQAGLPELVPVVRNATAEQFVPRQSGYYASLFRRLRELALL